MSRIVAILGGDDWADASVEHVEVPDDMDLDEMRYEYNKWYRNTHLLDESASYLGFADWLVLKHPVKWADVEEYEAL